MNNYFDRILLDNLNRHAFFSISNRPSDIMWCVIVITNKNDPQNNNKS